MTVRFLRHKIKRDLIEVFEKKQLQQWKNLERFALPQISPLPFKLIVSRFNFDRRVSQAATIHQTLMVALMP